MHSQKKEAACSQISVRSSCDPLLISLLMYFAKFRQRVRFDFKLINPQGSTEFNLFSQAGFFVEPWLSWYSEICLASASPPRGAASPKHS